MGPVHVVGLTLVAALGAASCGVDDAAVTASVPDSTRRDREESAPVDPEAVRPFAINVPQSALDDLQERLARTRFPDEIDGAD